MSTLDKLGSRLDRRCKGATSVAHALTAVAKAVNAIILVFTTIMLVL